ncbi:hypothetical protein OH76DRAFT_195616 [Lentinus brumalis]|uniref:Uncharacterized protein n=1 Tax=Lentinus brumalis TaxID=2498619 RepID=A0A371DI11_9APHY|nr:hypothetical protein OH76DRAFT_195616 [Polyporus brumalis]
MHPRSVICSVFNQRLDSTSSTFFISTSTMVQDFLTPAHRHTIAVIVPSSPVSLPVTVVSRAAQDTSAATPRSSSHPAVPRTAKTCIILSCGHAVIPQWLYTNRRLRTHPGTARQEREALLVELVLSSLPPRASSSRHQHQSFMPMARRVTVPTAPVSFVSEGVPARVQARTPSAPLARACLGGRCAVPSASCRVFPDIAVRSALYPPA